jgi:hypothetical protein
VKIYVAAMEALRETERECVGLTQFTTKIDGFSSFTPRFSLCRFFAKSHPWYDQTQDSGAVFSLLDG